MGLDPAFAIIMSPVPGWGEDDYHVFCYNHVTRSGLGRGGLSCFLLQSCHPFRVGSRWMFRLSSLINLISVASALILPIIISPPCQFFKFSNYRIVTFPNFQISEFSNFQIVTLPNCPIVKLLSAVASDWGAAPLRGFDRGRSARVIRLPELAQCHWGFSICLIGSGHCLPRVIIIQSLRDFYINDLLSRLINPPTAGKSVVHCLGYNLATSFNPL